MLEPLVLNRHRLVCNGVNTEIYERQNCSNARVTRQAALRPLEEGFSDADAMLNMVGACHLSQRLTYAQHNDLSSNFSNSYSHISKLSQAFRTRILGPIHTYQSR